MSNRVDDMPDFHDGLLTGVLVFNKGAMIHVTTVDGAPWTIRLKGVLILRIVDMCEGNIILDSEVMETSDGLDAVLEELVRGYQRDTDLKRWKEAIDSGSHKLLLITPSYGATALALAESIETIPGHFLAEESSL